MAVFSAVAGAAALMGRDRADGEPVARRGWGGCCGLECSVARRAPSLLIRAKCGLWRASSHEAEVDGIADAGLTAAKVLQVRQDALQVRLGHTEPACQSGRVLVDGG